MSTTKKSGSGGFSEAERAAMKARAQELKAQGRGGQKKADNEQAVLETIAEMPAADRSIAERIHALVTANTPNSCPRTWYGIPAYANPDGKLVCFFKAASKFDGRLRCWDSKMRPRSTTARCGRSCSRSSNGPQRSRRSSWR